MIKSSIALASHQEQQISGAGGSMQLGNVAGALVQGVVEHSMGEQLYDTMRGILEDYAEAVSRDAKVIKEIAWGFDEVDQAIAKEHKSK